MVKKYLSKILIFIVISALAEVLLFNYRAVFSATATEQELEIIRQGDVFYAIGMDGAPGYVYIGIENYTEDGAPLTTAFTIAIQDEGNANYYDAGELTLYSPIEKSKYLRLHSYGAVKGIRITVNAASSETVQITRVIYDAKVPWFISVPRILILFVALCLVWFLRPSSDLYVWEWKMWQKRLAVSVLLLANIGLFFALVRSNPAFLQPVWPYHQQYHQLAVALSQGHVDIAAGNEEMLQALNALENPYDFQVRTQLVPGAANVWDTCYYNGKFYVYFGVVPVLLFYLPYYLMFHGAFPTWLGVFLAGSGILGGVYYLLDRVRRRWFPDSPYVWYLILSVIMGNHLNLFCAMLHADYYYLPILLALCFSLWGIGLMISAADRWKETRGHVAFKLAAGALCLALTAGCRPQFLVGSFLVIPILHPCFRDWLRQNTGKVLILRRIVAIVLPYLIVAAGLMYYNFIRFGSVMDFGANYNLTTNDMTRRGLELGRLPDGIFMYLFQPVSLKLRFPFAEVTAFYSNYLGQAIRDWTFGGAFWTHAVLFSLIGIAVVKKELQQKRLFGLTMISLGMALLVVAADTEMAGILNRYRTDFLWLLMLPAVIVLFQMLEHWQGRRAYTWLVAFVLLAGAWGIFYELAAAFRGSGIMNDNIHRYYTIQSFFQ